MIWTNNMRGHAKKQLKSFRRWVSKTFRSFSPDELTRGMARAGVCKGDTLLIHSSFDAFEGFQGKPSDVIAVLQGLVGAEGLLMMPTMTFSGTAVEFARSKAIFDVVRTPSRMGLLTELFRRSPGVVRSVHPTHPVAMWGHDADAVARGHHLAGTPCGVGTPFEALLQRQGKIVLLGTDISVLTFYHFLEETLEAALPLAPFTTELFHMQSRMRDGQVLDTHCRLFEPASSRRRNLYKLVPHLKQMGAWREAKVGGLKIVVLGTTDVDAAVRSMVQQGAYCYD